MADVKSIFSAMAQRRSAVNEEVTAETSIVEEAQVEETEINEEEEEIDVYEEAAQWLADNGYEVDEESIDAVVADWARMGAIREYLESCGYEVEEGVEEEIFDYINSMDEEEEEPEEDEEEPADEPEEAPAEEPAAEEPEEVEEAKEEKCPKCKSNPCKCGKDEEEDMRDMIRSIVEDVLAARDADIEEQGGGANLKGGKTFMSPENDGKVRSTPACSSPKAVDQTPAHPDVVARGKKVSTTSKKLHFAEEAEVEEEPVVEDIAELQARLEECGASEYMIAALSEGKTDFVRRYLEIKEN